MSTSGRTAACPSAEGTKPGCSSLAVVFPNGMQAYGGLARVVRDAFDEALL